MPPKRSKDKEKPDISGFLKLKKELSAGKPVFIQNQDLSPSQRRLIGRT